MNVDELKQTLAYLHSELSRMETVAGTLASVEREHYNRLTRFDHRDLLDVAVEEQSAARQLGALRETCLALAQRVSEVKGAMDRGMGEATGHAQAH